VIPLGLRAALRHLTILPLRWDAREEGAAGASIAWFPLVGASIGAIVAGVLLLPLPPLGGAALALLVWTALPAGLHEDAVMDCADAALAVATPERRMMILKDPHVGSHAVTFGVLLLLIRFAGLVEAPAVAAFCAPVVGRWSMALTVAHGASRGTGLGARFAEHAPRWLPSIAAICVLGVTCAFTAWWLAAACIIGIAGGLAAARILARRLGGYSGDVHGAGGVLGETFVLVVAGWIVQ
jgi:adenosylcobinamide-GDP ribazoletransferase